MYPEFAEIDGVEYKIDTDFKTALKCFEVIENDTIRDEEKTMAVIYLLFDFLPEDIDLMAKLFDKATIFLQCGKTYEEQSSNEKDMDFIQDRAYINSSFMSDYKLDLNKCDLHFWQFIELIEGLTNDSILSRVREIRTMDISNISDRKEKEKLEKEKKRLALKNKKTSKKKEFNEEQQKNMEAFYKNAEIN